MKNKYKTVIKNGKCKIINKEESMQNNLDKLQNKINLLEKHVNLINNEIKSNITEIEKCNNVIYNNREIFSEELPLYKHLQHAVNTIKELKNDIKILLKELLENDIELNHVWIKKANELGIEHKITNKYRKEENYDEIN